MARLPVRAIKMALAKQKMLHKQQFDQLRSESLTENNGERVKQIIKSIPKDKKCKDPLEYNPDMKHFTGSIHGQKLEEPMKEKDLYNHLVSKGVSDRDATELIVRLKAPYENKEKIDKLLQTAQKFGHMAKKQSESRKRKKGKFLPLTDKQKERQEKYHKLKRQHEDNAKKLGHDPKHPLWSKPTDPLDSIRKAATNAKPKTKLESIMEALSGSDIVRRYTSKGADFRGAVNKPKGDYSTPVKSAIKKAATTTASKAVSKATGGAIKPSKLAKPKVSYQKAGTFRRLAGALAGAAVSGAFSSAGPVGRVIGSHLSTALSNKIGLKKIKP